MPVGDLHKFQLAGTSTSLPSACGLIKTDRRHPLIGACVDLSQVLVLTKVFTTLVEYDVITFDVAVVVMVVVVAAGTAPVRQKQCCLNTPQ